MGKKVVVAMSGGVDSSVAAALLHEAGYEVIGVTLRLFDAERDRPACCGAEDAGAAARAVCGALVARHYIKDARKVFKRKVIDGFVESYASGSTPNPCVDCNRFVKFDYLLGLAGAFGAEYLATGHYARIEKGRDGLRLLRGADPLKDQSYFLYCLKKESLPHILFPLGNMTKDATRKKARALRLNAAEAGESADICFVGGTGYGRYLGRHGGLKPRRGRIVDLSGRMLGRHDGFFNYTVGQRRGVGVYGAERLYVTALRPETNEVVLGPLAEAAYSSFKARGMNWLAARPRPGARLSAQIRYRHKPAACLADDSEEEGFSGVFDEPQFAPANGQAVVFYEGDRVLGGGTICGVGK